MADMLVKLYNLPDSKELEHRLLEEGIRIKKALTPDRRLVLLRLMNSKRQVRNS